MPIPFFINKTLSGKKNLNINQFRLSGDYKLKFSNDPSFPAGYGLLPNKEFKPIIIIPDATDRRDDELPPEDPKEPGGHRNQSYTPELYSYSTPIIKSDNGEFFKNERISTIMLPYKRPIAQFNLIGWQNNYLPSSVETFVWNVPSSPFDEIYLSTFFFRNVPEKYLSFVFKVINTGGEIKFTFANQSSFDDSIEPTETGLQRFYIDISSLTQTGVLLTINLASTSQNGLIIQPISLTLDTDDLPLPFEET